MDNSILGSEKVNKASYKQKFRQYTESNPLLTDGPGLAKGAKNAQSVQEQDGFHSYAINLGAKVINKNVKNIGQQITQVKVPVKYTSANRHIVKNFKEDQVAPLQDST